MVNHGSLHRNRIREEIKRRQLYLQHLRNHTMADAVMTYAIAAGIFAFLTAILFGSRAARKRSHGGVSSESSHPEAA
jgi:ABC-type transport system involved in cytochrome c biogenesis permease subunit